VAGAHLPREGGGSARRESSLVWLIGLSPLADTRTRTKAAVTARGWCYNVALTMGRADRAESMVLMYISAREKKTEVTKTLAKIGVCFSTPPPALGRRALLPCRSQGAAPCTKALSLVRSVFLSLSLSDSNECASERRVRKRGSGMMGMQLIYGVEKGGWLHDARPRGAHRRGVLKGARTPSARTPRSGVSLIK